MKRFTSLCLLAACPPVAAAQAPATEEPTPPPPTRAAPRTAPAPLPFEPPGRSSPSGPRRHRLQEGTAATSALDGLEIGGRVFVRETFDALENGPWTGVLDLNSVRLNVRYEKKRLTFVVKLDAASGNAKLRDGYLQLRVTDQVSVRAGRFRMPASIIETTSRWTLPTVDRGFLSDVFDDGLEVAGRRVGTMAIWKGTHRLAPTLQIGAFQSRDITGDAQEGTLAQRFGLDGVARGSLTPLPELELEVWASTRLAHDGTSAIPHREWATGAGAALDLDDHAGPRAWAELTAGSSALDATPASTERVHFGSARTIVAWRLGARAKRWYLEPFVSGSVLDPDLAVADDIVWETAAGLNGGQWKRWRVQLQLEMRQTGANRPMELAGDLDLRDRRAATVQIGAAF
ncbi:MAG: porin [Kofleriaceae bacterium]|nr:porin [Kofleriaceae bacterium]